MDGTLAELDPPSPDIDEHAWLLHQAAALRDRRFAVFDPDNLARFLEYMVAGRDEREVTSCFRDLLANMLKLVLQPDRAGRVWAVRVTRLQHDLEMLIDAPSLRQFAENRYAEIWQSARRFASIATGLPLTEIPSNNPWTLDEAVTWDPPRGQPTLRPRARSAHQGSRRWP